MNPWHWFLDKSIYYSFDKSGYLRHQKRFDESCLDHSMEGKVCVVTGANSGLGFETARALAHRGATLYMLCRNEERGRAALNTIREESKNPNVHLALVDLSELASIHAFLDRFDEQRVDVLIHNAGLLPLERQKNSAGLELTVATHVVGPFLLTQALKDKLAGGRIIWVSSGGMYSKRLDLAWMLNNEGEYDGVAAYAMTKRAQVVLSELFAARFMEIGATVNSMHPGWASTSGVEKSLPKFFKRMKKRLRTAEQGADTIVWLAVAEAASGASGKFWFDRAAVKTHLFGRTKESDEERAKLWAFCEEESTRGV